MKMSECCNREVIVMDGSETAQLAAELMRKHHVGDVVLVDDADETRKPIGILTDRDLVVEVMVPGLNAQEISASDLLTTPLLKVNENDDLFETVQFMQSKCIRRLPVVNDQDELIGITTIDDISQLLVEMLGRLGGVVEKQIKLEEQTRP